MARTCACLSARIYLHLLSKDYRGAGEEDTTRNTQLYPRNDATVGITYAGEVCGRLPRTWAWQGGGITGGEISRALGLGTGEVGDGQAYRT